MAITARQKLVSSDKYSIKCPYAMVGEFFVVHNTANDASANNEVSYMIGNTSEVSFHFAIDDIEVVQGIPINRNAWHAGDGGSGNGNRKGISLEICYSKSGGAKFDAAEKLAAKFLAQELKARGWGIDKVKKHQDFSGKYCPHRTLDLGWQRFLNMVQAELNALNAPPPAPEPTGQIYRIRKVWADAFKEGNQIGAYRNLDEAKSIADANPGYSVFDEAGNKVYPVAVTPPPAPAVMYRVRKAWSDAASQAGAYRELDNAKAKADELVSEGYKVFDDAGNVVYTPVAKPATPPPVTPPPVVEPPKPVDPPKPVEPVAKEIVKHSLMGKSELTAYQLATYLLSKNSAPKISCTAYQIAEMYIAEGTAEGVRGDLAFLQTCHETGFFKFGGDAKPEWNNFAGIGVTGAKYDPATAVERVFTDGVITIWTPKDANGKESSIGVKFATPILGVRAQIQHLKAYATAEALKTACVDPRYSLVSPLGKAPTLEDLAGKWAVPGFDKNAYASFVDAWNADTTYGQLIYKLFSSVAALPKEPPAEPKPPVEESKPPVVEQTPPEEPAPVEDKPEVVDKEELSKGLLSLIVEFLVKLFQLFGKK